MYNIKGINHSETKDFVETKDLVPKQREVLSMQSAMKMSIFAMSKRQSPTIIITKPEEEQVRTGVRVCCE